MSIKNQVLEILENNQGNNISGEDIAKALNVTRNAVWKAVNALKHDGYEIASTSNGYMLSCEIDVFSANRISRLSKNDIRVVMLEETTSSNDIAKELALQGAPEGTLVVAKRQSAGRGRLGRSFISNDENGLYMSLILRPEIPIQESVNITVMGAVAVLEAIESTSVVKCSIKWVNDIYIDNKKVCGILSEASFNFESASTDYVIIGMGVNIAPPKNGFDSEIKDIATSIYPSKIPNGYKSLLCAEIVDRFLHYYKNLKDKKYIDVYRSKSNLIGKEVSVYRGNDIIDGIVLDIDDSANLILKSDGGVFKFNSGEARARRKRVN